MSRTKCVYFKCGNSKLTHPHLSFFHFPPERDRQFEWIARCGNPKLSASKITQFCICSKHFKQSSFRGPGKLARDAVPEHYLYSKERKKVDNGPAAVKSCCIQDCENPGIHKFPTDPELRNDWIQSLKLQDYLNPPSITSESRLCAVHFDESNLKHTDGKAPVPPSHGSLTITRLADNKKPQTIPSMSPVPLVKLPSGIEIRKVPQVGTSGSGQSSEVPQAKVVNISTKGESYVPVRIPKIPSTLNTSLPILSNGQLVARPKPPEVTKIDSRNALISFDSFATSGPPGHFLEGSRELTIFELAAANALQFVSLINKK